MNPKHPFFRGINICLRFHFEKHHDVVILTLILGPITKKVNLVHHSSLLRTPLAMREFQTLGMRLKIILNLLVILGYDIDDKRCTYKYENGCH